MARQLYVADTAVTDVDLRVHRLEERLARLEATVRELQAQSGEGVAAESPAGMPEPTP